MPPPVPWFRGRTVVVTEVDGTKHEIYPLEGRFRNLSYSAPLSLAMTPIVDGREQETELVLIGDLPVMLKSKLCVSAAYNACALLMTSRAHTSHDKPDMESMS